jgi:Nickel responsive protein SCO4226-like
MDADKKSSQAIHPSILCLATPPACCVAGGRLYFVPQFIIEREIPGAGALSEAQIREISLHSLQVLRDMGPQIQWLHSYVTEDKVYCVYLAPDENSIREHARRVGLPADRVAAVRQLINTASLT